MILFRKHKVQKILNTYFAEYNRVIPEKVLARAELLKLKELNLQDLASQYDALEGYQYFEVQLDGCAPLIAHVIPDKSDYCPSSTRWIFNNEMAIQRRLVRLRSRRFIKNTDYLTYAIRVEGQEIVYSVSSGSCWKKGPL